MQDYEERLRRVEAKLGRLLEDYHIGTTLTSPFPEAPSSMSLRHKGNEYYLGGCQATRPIFSTLAVTADRLYALPFYIPSAPNIADRIAIRVTTLSAGNARLGIYDNGNNLSPGALLLDAGAVSTSSTGIKTVTIRKGLTRGLKWLVVVFSVTPTVLSIDGNISGTGAWGILGADAASDWERYFPGWSVAHSYAALPVRFPTGGVKRSNEPVIALRFT